MKTNTTDNEHKSDATNNERKTKGFGVVGTAVHSTQNIFATGKTAAKKYIDAVDSKIQEVNEARELKKLSPMAKSSRGSFTGPFQLVLGLIILSCCLGYIGGAYYLYHMDLSYILLVTIIPFIICLYLILAGYRATRRSEIYNRYKAIFKQKPYASIRELSDSTGQTEYKTVKNLKSFTEEGLYPEGRFSSDNKYFVLSEGAMDIMTGDVKRKEAVVQEEQERKVLEESYPELFKICGQITEATEAVDELRHHKTPLQKPQLRDELDKMDTLLKQIQTYIQSNPVELPNMSHFLDYFLPTVTKLLDTYCELDNQKIQTKNVRESKEQIESSFQNINSALTNIYNDFYTGTAMDVHSDVVVLKSMIEHEGFADPDFK